MIIEIDTSVIEAARERLTKAREIFDKARDSRLRSEYDLLFKEVLTARNAYNKLRYDIIQELNLEIM
jgi:hypothetical protein